MGVVMETIWEPRTPETTEQDDAKDPAYFRVEESTALLYLIFPNYPDLSGMKPVPESRESLRALRAGKSRAASAA